MPVIFGNVTDVARFPNEGVMEVRSPKFRPGGTAVVTEDPRAYPIVDGRFETDDLEPGEVKFYLRGVRYREDFDLVVPDTEEPVDFLDLLDTAYEYPEEVVGQAQEAARAARVAANDAEASATRAENLYGDLAAVQQARDTSVQAASQASASAGESSDSATLAETARQASVEARTAAQTAQTAAEDAQVAAESAQASAQASATLASSEADRSETAANTSRGYNDTAWTARQDARAARTAAETAQAAAEAAQAAAQNYESAAADSAAAAAQSEGVATTAASDAAAGVRSELSDLVSTASGHADAAAGSAADAAQSAQDAASVVADGVPDASTSIKGKIQLAGDLAGTADVPTVPGLADKSDVGHGHAVGEVAGLQADLDGKVSTTSVGNRVYVTDSSGNQTALPWQSGTAAADSVAVRGSGGRLLVGGPTVSGHATTKNYVDARPALFSGEGAAPSAIPGAVVGDWWLNTATMELSRITGV